MSGKLTSIQLSEKARAQIDQICKNQDWNMVTAITESVNYYFEQVMMNQLITDLWAFKGKLCDLGLKDDRFNIKDNPVMLLSLGKIDELRNLVSLWSMLASESGQNDLLVEGTKILDRLE